jgi:two-component system chemotaxis response regulator CheY
VTIATSAAVAKSVLVVDDSPTMRKMVKAALQPLKPSFGEAANGLEAIEKLALNHYDVMILDLNMPDMHGLEVIQFTRAYETYKDLPIVVLTTRSEDQTREAVLQAGANRYVTKPFQAQHLLGAVQELLGNGP